MGPDHDDIDARPTELVIVACHGTYLGSGEQGSDKGNWLLAPYQAGEEEQLVFHAKVGTALAADAPARRLLVFSGGVTARTPGAGSEAASYERLCTEKGWFGQREIADLAYCEEYARDSFENVLYSICRFREVTGEYPRMIHAVSWGFKEKRFDIHRRALRIPAPSWHFYGAGQPADPVHAKAREAITRHAWREDPYGTSPELDRKRTQRNPASHREAYAAACPELVGILAYAGPGLYADKLPWT